MSRILAEINFLEDSITAKRSSKDKAGKIDDAGIIEDCDKAIGILKSQLDAVEEKCKKRQNDALVERRNILAKRLANFYGIKGGALRRKERLNEALSMYQKGYKIESNDAYNIQDSYNLVNRFTLQISLDPQSLQALEDELKKSLQLINTQLEDVRRDEWWAWADIGQLYLLSGEPKNAHLAYEKFMAKGPNRNNYESVIRVLGDLKNALSKISSPIIEDIDAEIKFLKKNMP